MICRSCGTENTDSAFCKECGSALASSTAAYAASPSASKGMVVTGLVLSLAGLLVFAVPLGIAGTVLGAISRSRGARGMATAALVIGIIDIVLGVILIASTGRFF